MNEVVKTVAENSDKVLVEVYRDGLSPAMKAVGNIVALPFQAIDVALSKPKLWVAEQQYNYERTKNLLAEKLKDTPVEKIVPPENYVAIPALQQISYCFDSDELRDMYANLLAASMQEDKKWGVHPSFVDIIKQLTPDEAKLLKALPASLYKYHPTIDVHVKLGADKGYQVVYSNYTTIANDICDCPQNICAYLENLDRLKLIELDKNTFIKDESVYDKLKNTPEIQKFLGMPLAEGQSYDFQKGCFRLTSFGLSFVKMCILGA